MSYFSHTYQFSIFTELFQKQLGLCAFPGTIQSLEQDEQTTRHWAGVL